MLDNQKRFFNHILYAFFTIFFFYLMENKNIFLYVFSLSLITIFSHLLENISYKNILKKHYEVGEHLQVLKLKNISVLSVVGLTFVLSIFNYFLGTILNIYLNIDYLPQTFFIASLTVCVKPLFLLLKEYLLLYGYKKNFNNIHKIFLFLNIFFFLLNILLFFKWFPISDLLAIYTLFISPLLALIFTYLYTIILFYNQKKKLIRSSHSSFKIKYKQIWTDLFSHNLNVSIKSTFINSFTYLSILFLYYSLYRIYHYSFEEISNTINLTYFYAMNCVLVMVYVSYDIVKKKISSFKKILQDKEQFSLEVNQILNRLLKILLPIVILSSILYKSLWKLVFDVPFTSEIIIFLIFMAFFFLLYLILLSILDLFQHQKILYYPILISLSFKLIMTIPLINSFYMMGYNQVFGEIFSTIASYAVGSIACVIILNRKYKVDFVHNFPKLLSLVYDNIILTLILILSSLIFPIDPESRLEALGSILIYIIIEMLYFLAKKYFNKLMFEKNNVS